MQQNESLADGYTDPSECTALQARYRAVVTSLGNTSSVCHYKLQNSQQHGGDPQAVFGRGCC